MEWTYENGYSIGKYASEHENTASVHSLQKQFPNIKESAVREFKKRYDKQPQEVKKINFQPPTSIKSNVQRLDLGKLLGKFDSMVLVSDHGAVIIWSMLLLWSCCYPLMSPPKH